MFLSYLFDLLALIGFIAIIVGLVLLIRRSAKPKSTKPQAVAGGPTAAAAGWYRDPNDAAMIRYFDGQVWTSFTQPSG